jgi:thiol-disulfide isomerase/thioredoxin
MGKGDKGMGTTMHRLIFFACLAFLANFSFAQKPSERLSMPKELQSELPWFAMVEKDGEGIYNGVLSKDRLKILAAQKNSKRVVLAFYATWCIPCREGLTKLSEKAAELEKGNVLVVLVNVGEDDYAKTNKWVNKYVKNGWLLGFDKFNNLSGNFGLSKPGEEMPLPRTLLLDQNLRPLMLIGYEGDDYPQILKD